MSHTLARLRRALDRVNAVAAAIAAGAVIAGCASITWAVVGRGAFGLHTVWEMEASVYLLIYAAFLGAAYTHRHGAHVAVDLLTNRLSAQGRWRQALLLDALALALFLLLLASGWAMFAKAWSTGWTSDTLWGPPLWIPYAAIPLGAGLMVLNLLVDILSRLAGQHTETPAPGSGHH